MDGLISLLLIGGAFFLMMRFGCGAHMVHGDHGGHGRHDQSGTNHVDPVCGMEVDMKNGYGKMHEGKLYRFCSRDCLDAFEASPERYVGGHKAQEGGAA